MMCCDPARRRRRSDNSVLAYALGNRRMRKNHCLAASVEKVLPCIMVLVILFHARRSLSDASFVHGRVRLSLRASYQCIRRRDTHPRNLAPVCRLTSSAVAGAAAITNCRRGKHDQVDILWGRTLRTFVSFQFFTLA